MHRSLAAAAVAALLAGCTCGPTGDPPSDSAPSDSAVLPSDAASPADASDDAGQPGSDAASATDASTATACDVIDGRTYQSLAQMECGLGPMGPVYCNWIIVFAAGSWDWYYSDVVETGTYTCSGWTVLGAGFGATYTGLLDPVTGILTWDGADYEPI